MNELDDWGYPKAWVRRERERKASEARGCPAEDAR